MALRLIEGWEAFTDKTTPAGDPVGLESKYTVDTPAGFTMIAGRIGGAALQHDTNIEASRYIQTPNLIATPTMVVGMAIWRPATVANDRMVFGMYDGNGALGMNVRILAAGGEYQIRRGTTILETTSGAGISETWHYAEFKVVTHDTTGSYELRINTVDVASDNNVDTKAGTSDHHASVRFNSFGGRIDDVYIDDLTFHGDKSVKTLFPVADGVNNTFTPSSGSDNFALVSESPSDEDSTYVESDGTVGHKELYEFDTLVANNIVGVQVNSVIRATDVTPADVSLVARGSDGTEDLSDPLTVNSVDWSTKSAVYELDPTASTAWTQAGVNAAEFGIEVV